VGWVVTSSLSFPLPSLYRGAGVAFEGPASGAVPGRVSAVLSTGRPDCAGRLGLVTSRRGGVLDRDLRGLDLERDLIGLEGGGGDRRDLYVGERSVVT
jgi:hypothetical protein